MDRCVPITEVHDEGGVWVLGKTKHEGSQCASCTMNPIVGLLMRNSESGNSLCEACYQKAAASEPDEAQSYSAVTALDRLEQQQARGGRGVPWKLGLSSRVRDSSKSPLFGESQVTVLGTPESVAVTLDKEVTNLTCSAIRTLFAHGLLTIRLVQALKKTQPRSRHLAGKMGQFAGMVGMAFRRRSEFTEVI